MAQRIWGRELASRGAPWQKRAGCWQQKAGWGMRMEERRKPGGKKQREEGPRPVDTGPGPRKTKNKQTKTRRLGRGDAEKEDQRGQGEATVRRNAAQAAVRNGFRVAGRGTPPTPPCHPPGLASHPVAAGAAQADRSAAPAAATGARRQDGAGAAPGLARRGAVDRGALTAEGQTGRLALVPGAGALGLGGAALSPGRAPPLHCL